MMRRVEAVFWAGLCLALLAEPRIARAEGPASASAAAHLEVGSPEAVAAARTHFTRGKELYQAGSYREAIMELDKARALDPKAKDLVFNLGIVHEKLGEIDEALRYARLYAQMDLEPAERERAETYIKRLEGAKTEVLVKKPSMEPSPESRRVRGRLDAATIAVGVVAVGAAAAGIAFGIKALTDKPPQNVTVLMGGFNSLNAQVASAHTEAVVADVCFGGAVAAAAATAVLYFTRYRDAPPAGHTGGFTVAPFVARSSGGVFLGGSF